MSSLARSFQIELKWDVEHISYLVRRAALIYDVNPVSCCSGPDLLVEAGDLWTTQRDAAVKLRTETEGPLSETPVSVVTVFQRTVKRFPKHAALCQKVDGQWKNWTYDEYYRDVRQVARAFIKLGLEAYHGVGIIGFNSPEWFISDLAAIFAG